MKLVYPAVFTPLETMQGYCVAFPDLPGCVTQGNSLADAITMAVDAASGWVLDEIEDGKKPPSASSPNDIKLDNTSEFVNLVVLDMDAYAEQYGQIAIRKTGTIPAWLNTMSEQAHINFSAVLQEALIQKLHIS